METKPREVVVLGFVDNTALVKKGPNGITSLLLPNVYFYYTGKLFSHKWHKDLHTKCHSRQYVSGQIPYSYTRGSI